MRRAEVKRLERRGRNELIAARVLWTLWMLPLWPLSRRVRLPDDGLTSLAAWSFAVAAVLGVLVAAVTWLRGRGTPTPAAPGSDWWLLAASGGLAGLAVKLFVEGVTADPGITLFLYFLVPVLLLLAAHKLGEPPRRVLLASSVLLLVGFTTFIPELRARGTQRTDRAILCAVGVALLYTARALLARRLLDRHRIPTLFAWEAVGAAAVLLLFAAGSPRPPIPWAVVAGAVGIVAPGLLYLGGLRRTGIAPAAASQWIEAALGLVILLIATMAL